MQEVATQFQDYRRLVGGGGAPKFKNIVSNVAESLHIIQLISMLTL